MEKERTPEAVFVIGPPGAGKTTVLACLASRYSMEKKMNAAMVCADTYAVGAADILKEYAGLMDIPMEILFSPEDTGGVFGRLAGCDAVLVDTCGFQNGNEEEIKRMVDGIPAGFEKKVFLALPATMKAEDLKAAVDTCRSITDDYGLITHCGRENPWFYTRRALTVRMIARPLFRCRYLID